MSAQFVDGWTIAQVLGEGAFGEVCMNVMFIKNQKMSFLNYY